MRLLLPRRSLPAWLFGVVLVVTSMAVFVPLLPSQPEAGLDPSWALGMNQAVAQGLRFGHDVIFPFGPYAAVYTWQFHPATDGLMVFGGLWIAAGFTVAAYLTLRREPWSLQICFLLAMMAVSPLRDALFFAYPLLVGMLVCGMNPEQKPLRSAPLLALLMVPLGLMPLVKQSMSAACLVAVVVSAMMLVYHRQWRLSFTTLSVPVVSMALFWTLSGQYPGDLWPYFASGAAVISGYTQAMALDGNPFEAIVYTLAAVFIIARVAQGDAGENLLTRGCRSLLFAGLLFLAFKAGFVRHDIHGLIAASFVLLCTLLVAQMRTPRPYFPVLLAGLLAFGMIVQGHPGRAKTMIKHIGQVYTAAARGIGERILNPDFLEQAFQTHLAAIHTATNLPTLTGTTDIYSYNQSGLLAARNSWQPRPVLQSYAAYSPDLAEVNRLHLLGERRPDNLIFRVQPIDRRLPSLEDGPSWRVILSDYVLASISGDSLILRRDATKAGNALPAASESVGAHELGETVAVNATQERVFARIEVKLTPWGRLRNLAFKPGQLRIKLTTADQVEHTYRFIAAMAQSEFLLSPLVKTTAEFGLLYGPSHALDGKRVVSFSITDESWPPSWQARYTLRQTP